MAIEMSTPKVQTLQEQRIVLYSDPSGGKTTLTAGMKDALHIDLEDTMGYFSPRKRITVQMDDPIAACDELAADMQAVLASADPKNTKTVVLDSYPALYTLAIEAVKRQWGVSDPGDTPGRVNGWLELRAKMMGVLGPLFQLPQRGIGIVIIAHEERKEIKTPTGKKEKIAPVLAEKGTRGLIQSRTDLLLYLRTDANGHRYLHAFDDGHVLAKDRTRGFPQDAPLAIENAPHDAAGDDVANHMYQQVLAGFNPRGIDA